MTLGTTRVFDLPDRLAAKADPALVAQDERHFARLAETLEESVAELTGRLDAVRRVPGGRGQAAMDRDLEVHRLTSRLRTLRRFSLDLCLGRMVGAHDAEPVYVGRIGLADRSGDRLLVDWRSPAAEPFFGATLAHPMGLVSRRRYRWTGGRVTDYWDEVLQPEAAEGHVAPDDDSAFIASLGGARTARMRDVLTTLQADQDAIIRAGSRGPLVVEGGPGTGKTVVALHRSAYLLYADPRLAEGRGGILFVGPHQRYLAYVADVLPGLGEEGVRTCTLRDLVPEGAEARPETDARVARLKASADLVQAIEPAVALYEEPPSESMVVETPWADLELYPGDWAEAFAAPDPGTPHNQARDQVWDAVVDILADRLADRLGDEEVPDDEVRRSLLGNLGLREVFGGVWPRLDPADLVGDLWTVPAYLRRCAPWLAEDEVRLLQRKDPGAWTVADLPILDAARHRLGDPEASRRRGRRSAAARAEREQRDQVVGHLIATDDSEMHLMSMLRGADLQAALVGSSEPVDAEREPLAGPFAHVVVDEAQELTDAEWQMVLRRCPSRSLTVVGDRAQARHGFPEPWPERLARAGLGEVRLAGLTINYRTPEEVMAEAEPVIRAAVPDANVPVSVRATGRPVLHGRVPDLAAVLERWLAESHDGIACVIGSPTFRGTTRVSALTAETAKGLEFDLVVLVDRDGADDEDEQAGAVLGRSIEDAVDRYVAMTRATLQLVVLSGS